MTVKIVRLKPKERMTLIAPPGASVSAEEVAPNLSILYVDPRDNVQILVYTPPPEPVLLPMPPEFKP